MEIARLKARVEALEKKVGITAVDVLAPADVPAPAPAPAADPVVDAAPVAPAKGQ